MLRLWRSVLVLSLAFAGVALADTGSTVPTGRWVTANGQAVIQIAPCGPNLCGEIVGIARAHPNDPIPTDWRGQSTCGLTIIETAPAKDDAGNMIWQGSVLDPRDGSIYQAKIVLDTLRHLVLHGYLGLPIFGQTQTWTPYSGRTLADCRLASAPAAAAAAGNS